MSTLEVNTITPQSGTTLTLGGSGDTVSVASGVTNNLGITMADQFRLTTSFTGGATPIASNLARINTNAQGTLGTGMTESSGIFTFPSTGIYYVTFTVLINNVATDTSIEGFIRTTTDNSSYSIVATLRESVDGTSGENHQGTTSTLIDVTDTTLVKVRFDIASNAANNRIFGDTSSNNTHMTFIRLGDT